MKVILTGSSLRSLRLIIILTKVKVCGRGFETASLMVRVEELNKFMVSSLVALGPWKEQERKPIDAEAASLWGRGRRINLF